MYCFSQICRTCLKSTKSVYININKVDNDNVKVYEKLITCVPEILNPVNNLPEKICKDCYKFIKRMYKFRQMCIKNNYALNKYASKLTKNIDLSNNSKFNLIIEIDNINNTDNNIIKIKEELKSPTIETIITNTSSPINSILNEPNTFLNTSSLHNTSIKEENLSIQNINPPDLLNNSSSDGVSMYSISLNQWDLFETKYTCRCIKEFSSFTENTEHLCKNCEGELHGFRLSKIKVGVAENRYNKTRAKIKSENEDSEADTSLEKSDLSSSETNEFGRYEYGFDYNDVLLCKVHINGVKRQITHLENEINGEYDLSYYNIHDESMFDTSNSTIDTSLETKKGSKKTKFSKNGKQNICKICKKSFTRRYYLNKHYLTHTGTSLHECTKCAKRYINEEEFMKHMLSHVKASKKVHNNIETTPKPKVSFLTEEEELLISKKEVETDSELDESISATSSPKKSDLNSSEENLVCGTCDKVFTTKGNLAIHLMTHFGKKNYKCNTCNKQFFRKENLDEHLMQVHHTSDKKFKCSSCYKSYNHLTNLRRHTKNSHPVEKFVCSICNKRFVEKNKLEKHIFDDHTNLESNKKSVNQQNSYSCPICNKEFNHLSNLRMHALSHSESVESIETKYCYICKRLLGKNTSMKKHMMTHESGNTFFCRICHESFDNRWVMQQHVKVMHPGEDKVYKCKYCTKIYCSSSSLKIHQYKNHRK